MSSPVGPLIIDPAAGRRASCGMFAGALSLGDKVTSTDTPIVAAGGIFVSKHCAAGVLTQNDTNCVDCRASLRVRNTQHGGRQDDGTLQRAPAQLLAGSVFKLSGSYAAGSSRCSCAKPLGRRGRHRVGARSVARRSIPMPGPVRCVAASGLRVGGTLCAPPMAAATRACW